MELSFKNDNKSIKIVINDLLSHRLFLTEWELKFMTSIEQHYVTENKFLSDKQLQKLSDLWEKY